MMDEKLKYLLCKEIKFIFERENLSFKEMMNLTCNVLLTICVHYELSEEHLRDILQKMLTDYCEENYGFYEEDE